MSEQSTDKTALVAWLRAMEGPGSVGTNEAADLIESQAARIERLKAARDQWLGMYRIAADRALGFESMVREAGLPVRDGVDGTALAAHDRQIAEDCAQIVERYWDAWGELVASNIAARLAFEEIAAEMRDAFSIGSERREDAI